MDELYQGENYAFALANMDSVDADHGLESIVNIKTESEYSSNIQKYFKAALTIRNKNYKSDVEILKEVDYLNTRILNWSNFFN